MRPYIFDHCEMYPYFVDFSGYIDRDKEADAKEAVD